MNFMELRGKLLYWKVSHELLQTEIAQKYGDVLAWYRESRDDATNIEIDWFITAEHIFRMRITYNEASIKIWNRTNAVISEKMYKVYNAETGSNNLSETNLILMDKTKLVIPGPTDRDFIEQYKSFIGVLETYQVTKK